MTPLVLATSNSGKVREFQGLLRGLPLQLLQLSDFPDIPPIVEDGDTFAENATLKATAVARHTGHLALADDSGLVVDALGGAPGVYSARYAGPSASDAQNRAKLLNALKGLPPRQRTARFVAVIVVARPDGTLMAQASGTCEGQIIDHERGQHGFGYDCIFEANATAGQTLAELSLEAKADLSHRGQAMRQLLGRQAKSWS